MCMKTECDKCEKPTWKGCGKHIERALKDVPEDERCKCPRESTGSVAPEEKKPTEEATTTTETDTAETKEKSD